MSSVTKSLTEAARKLISLKALKDKLLAEYDQAREEVLKGMAGGSLERVDLPDFKVTIRRFSVTMLKWNTEALKENLTKKEFKNLCPSTADPQRCKAYAKAQGDYEFLFIKRNAEIEETSRLDIRPLTPIIAEEA